MSGRPAPTREHGPPASQRPLPRSEDSPPASGDGLPRSQRHKIPRRVLGVVTALAVVAAACSGPSATSATFCDQIVQMNEIDDALAGVELSDSDAVTAALDSFRDEFTQLAEASPEEISSDVEIVARFGTAIADAALASNPDDPFDTAAALAAATASEPEIEEALERVASYASRRCTTAPAS